MMASLPGPERVGDDNLGSGVRALGTIKTGKTGSINNKKRERETPNHVKVNYHPVWRDRKFGALLWDD
jgi:hypothetical protein